MDRAPDLNIEDDNGFVLAGFSEEDVRQLEPAPTGDGLGAVWIPIAAVQTFFPVSERAGRLLEADASRASAELGNPIFDRLWQHWRARRQRELINQRGRMLCKAFNLPHQGSDKVVPEAVYDLLMGLSCAPNTDKAERLRGSSTYGWALSIGIFGEYAGEDAKQELTDKLSLRESLASVGRHYTADKPVTRSPILSAGQQLTSYLRERYHASPSVVLIAVVLHYRHLFETDRSVSLESLLEDLAFVGDSEGLAAAGLAAQAIAGSMSDAAVTTLLYQSAPQEFRTLKHAAPPYPLDVSIRVKARQPIEPQNSTHSLPQDTAAPDSSPSESVSARDLAPTSVNTNLTVNEPIDSHLATDASDTHFNSGEGKNNEGIAPSEPCDTAKTPTDRKYDTETTGVSERLTNLVEATSTPAAIHEPVGGIVRASTEAKPKARRQGPRKNKSAAAPGLQTTLDIEKDQSS
jgi:hypothetical protein